MTLFLRFFMTGTFGALLSISITWALTTYLVGTENYFNAYLVGVVANLFFNFLMYTMAVFKTKHDHIRRLGVFLFYGVVMAFLQATTVQLVTAHLGVAWYLVIIAITIAFFAILNFFVFKLSIFKEYPDGGYTTTKTTLAFILLCSVLLRIAVLFHVLATAGLEPLVYGDAIGYRALAINIWNGLGFAHVTTYGTFISEVFRTPGLPLLLSPFAGSEMGLGVYLFLLAIVGGVLLPYLTYQVGKRMLSDRTALFPAMLVAFEPHLIFFSVLPQTEVPFMLFSYGALVAILHAYEKRLPLFFIFAGSLFGYATLIRPGFLPIYVVVMMGIFFFLVIKRMNYARFILLTLISTLTVLTPWYIRTHEVTGVYALSGAGWRNVYTDYLASVRAIENHTDFSSEKSNLKKTAGLAGVETEEVDSPASSASLRSYALHELWEKKKTVVKLESTLLVSYFLQDGYYYQFRRFLLVPSDEGIQHTSATFALLNKGIAGFKDVFEELARQLFIPILGRLFTLAVVAFGVIGFFTTRSRLRYVFAMVIVLSAITATAIGLGVEARLRLPVEPLLFIFAVIGARWCRQVIRKRHAH